MESTKKPNNNYSPKKPILIEFTRPWGHPTRYQILGAGERWYVSEWASRSLVPHYAKVINESSADE